MHATGDRGERRQRNKEGRETIERKDIRETIRESYFGFFPSLRKRTRRKRNKYRGVHQMRRLLRHSIVIVVVVVVVVD